MIFSKKYMSFSAQVSGKDFPFISGVVFDRMRSDCFYVFSVDKKPERITSNMVKYSTLLSVGPATVVSTIKVKPTKIIALGTRNGSCGKYLCVLKDGRQMVITCPLYSEYCGVEQYYLERVLFH